MKQIEDLIELLNEYEYDKRREKTLRWMTNWCLYYIQSINSYLNLKIISKEYGFIKWLVDNDKIDIRNSVIISFTSELGKQADYKDVLMLLSIQDNPIEFLISILK